MKNSEIIFRSSSLKLRKGSNEKAILFWNAESAKSIELHVPNIGVLSLSNKGEYVVQPQNTTQYKIVAKFRDGSEQVKHLKIEVLPEANATFDVEEKNDDNGAIAELRWSITNASQVTLNGEKVENKGWKKYLITKTTKFNFEYTDSFGLKSKRITIEPTNSFRYKIVKTFHTIWSILVGPFICPVTYDKKLFLSITILSTIYMILPWLYMFNGDNSINARISTNDEPAIIFFSVFLQYYLFLMLYIRIGRSIDYEKNDANPGAGYIICTCIFVPLDIMFLYYNEKLYSIYYLTKLFGWELVLLSLLCFKLLPNKHQKFIVKTD